MIDGKEHIVHNSCLMLTKPNLLPIIGERKYSHAANFSWLTMNTADWWKGGGTKYQKCHQATVK
jgi:hypothetical protein